MKITHTHANSVSYGAKRAVQFYKSTRPQAPVRHKEAADLRDLVECSVCRGLFFVNDTAVKAAHRRLHEQEKRGEFYYPLPCHFVPDAYQGRYQFTICCDECGEDVCPCDVCNAQHIDECSQWQEVNELLAEDKEIEADALADKILAQRK